MPTPPVLQELPDGYFVEESPRGILVLHADVAQTLHEAGFGPESDGSLGLSGLFGRKPLFEIQAGGESFVVRRFSHGGLVRWFTRDRFLDFERPFRELILSDSLRRIGIATPQVVAARARMRRAGGWQLDVMTRRLERTVDLGVVLARCQGGDLRRDVRARLLVAVGEFVRRLHAHGCLHADLSPNNLLVSEAALEGGEPRIWVLDLDGSHFTTKLTERERLANLRRLYRHVSHREAQRGPALTAPDYARFFKGYDFDGNRWKADWHAIRARHTMARGFHAAGWALERLFSRTVDPRDELATATEKSQGD
ncbi:MAG: hypothetical protein E2O39_15975 [Planctomycetota bacterium]|nr:MAG: hypothetical protein E2O39_15975 [Planctomycetota bacterium]